MGVKGFYCWFRLIAAFEMPKLFVALCCANKNNAARIQLGIDRTYRIYRI